MKKKLFSGVLLLLFVTLTSCQKENLTTSIEKPTPLYRTTVHVEPGFLTGDPLDDELCPERCDACECPCYIIVYGGVINPGDIQPGAKVDVEMFLSNGTTIEREGTILEWVYENGTVTWNKIGF
jgi:hypothetical protein